MNTHTSIRKAVLNGSKNVSLVKSVESSNEGSIQSFTGNSQRFYPEQLPRFPYEPTRDRFSISSLGNDVGEGVRSLVSFRPGDVVFGFTGFFSNEVTLFSLQLSEGLHLHDPYFYGKLLHSCEPNMRADTVKRQFIAIKPIAKNDLITMDYARTEEYLFRTFPCGCGAKSCRGIVAGSKQQQELVVNFKPAAN